MREAEARRVQADAADRVDRRAVAPVADDRMAERLELRADLAAPAGFQLELEHRRGGAPFDDAEARDRFLARVAIVRAAHAQRRALLELVPHRAALAPHVALD